jgi:regulator-associated protein of mTOR
VYALGTFFGGSESNDSRVNIELNIAITLPVVTEDVSPLVRKELIIALSHLTHYHERQFKEAVALLVAEEKLKDGNTSKSSVVRAE